MYEQQVSAILLPQRPWEAENSLKWDRLGRC
jgi:hypothetical protein